MILQLEPQIEVITPLGRGWAWLIVDYGYMLNTVWIVRLDETGIVRHVNSNDIRIESNPMLGQKKIKP